jgi:hypothetical protein
MNRLAFPGFCCSIPVVSDTLEQSRPTGRPCLVCAHADRAVIEEALVDGARLSALSSDFSISTTSLRRHRRDHMFLETGWTAPGLDGIDVAAKLVNVQQRLQDLADEAEARGRIGDAVKALQAQAKTLTMISTDQPLDPLADLNRLAKACAQLIWSDPTLGHQLVTELARFDASAEVHDAFQRLTTRAEERLKEIQG